MVNWEKTKIGEVCEIINGAAFKSSDFINDGIPVIKIANVKPNKILLDNLQCVSKEIADKKEKAKIRYGDILLTLTGNRKEGGPDSWVGKAAMFRKHGDYVLNQRLCIIRPKNNRIDNMFLSYCISSWNAQLYFVNHSTSSGGQANISPSIVNDYEIELPDIETQRRIAEILNVLDLKILNNEKKNDNLQQQAFLQFEKLMSEHDPDDLCLLSEIADINPKRSIKKNTEARCIDMTKLSTKGAFPDGWEYKKYTGGVKFTNGDTLLARITPCLENGKTAYIDFLDENEIAFGSTEYIVLAPKGKMPSELLYCLARNKNFVDYAVKNMNGTSGRQRVSGEAIGQYLIPRFSDEEMNEFGRFSNNLFGMMRKNSLENINLTAMRDSLLPKLITGELDTSKINL